MTNTEADHRAARPDRAGQGPDLVSVPAVEVDQSIAQSRGELLRGHRPQPLHGGEDGHVVQSSRKLGGAWLSASTALKSRSVVAAGAVIGSAGGRR